MLKKMTIMLLCLTFVPVALAACAPELPPTPPTQQEVPSQTSPEPSPQGPEASTAPAQLIGEEKAKEIALRQAGISADGVIFDRVELDRDNGVLSYELEFRQGQTEYDADIKADDGTLLSWEIDRE